MEWRSFEVNELNKIEEILEDIQIQTLFQLKDFKDWRTILFKNVEQFSTIKIVMPSVLDKRLSLNIENYGSRKQSIFMKSPE